MALVDPKQTVLWFSVGLTSFACIVSIAGELETGVTRFVAVGVKTFILCLGVSFGMLVVGNATKVRVVSVLILHTT